MVLSFALLLLASRAAAAQVKEGRSAFGAGAEATTTGIVGGTFVYDAGTFHIDALLGGAFASNTSQLAVAGRFFFPLHRAQAADFSIGPGIGLVRTTRDPDDNGPQPSVSNTAVHVEGALQIRAFVVSNLRSRRPQGSEPSSPTETTAPSSRAR
jgi:hypothetical protein